MIIEYKVKCKNCNQTFGVHDTYILKPIFKKHICKEDNVNKIT